MRQWTTFRVGSAEFAVTSEPAPVALAPVLTAAEQDVVRRLLAGRSNAEIAKARRSSVRTVANQVASVFRKYGVNSRAELAARVAQ